MNENAVAMGAPMNPRRIGAGPHTTGSERRKVCYSQPNVLTEEIVNERVDGRDYDHDARGHGEEAW